MIAIQVNTNNDIKQGFKIAKIQDIRLNRKTNKKKQNKNKIISIRKSVTISTAKKVYGYILT